MKIKLWFQKTKKILVAMAMRIQDIWPNYDSWVG